jgi:arsenite methyltransferase
MMTTDHDTLQGEVRNRYASAAHAVARGANACSAADEVCFGLTNYDEISDLPEAAALASLGCGNPLAVADLRLGDTVLDLGSGGGIDVLLSARRVGPAGHVYGLDMTPEMVRLARSNAAEAGVGNVEFLEGRIEAIPLPDASIDVVISNCVVNLSPHKAAVFAECHRVLRPGGRLGIADVVVDDALTESERVERSATVGCIAGALRIREYVDGLRDAGFVDVVVAPTHTVGDGVLSAIIRATKP